ncbi:MAG: hypothetical protein HY794_13395 [Desulfarculus sp.]|nr:hypothetical protein [Desulfarculus sp.]
MRDADLGITRDDTVAAKFVHAPDLTPWERRAVAVLGDFSREYPGEYLPADELAEAVGLLEYGGKPLDAERAKRYLRKLVNHLIEHHEMPIAPLPGVKGGYRLASSRAEIEASVGPHLRRVRTGMRKVSCLQGAAEILAQEMVQLTLDLGGQTPVEIHKALGERLGAGAGPATLGQVQQALARYQSDPERYAREISDLAEQFGGLFVRATVLEEARQALAKAQEAVTRAMTGTRAEAA